MVYLVFRDELLAKSALMQELSTWISPSEESLEKPWPRKSNVLHYT